MEENPGHRPIGCIPHGHRLRERQRDVGMAVWYRNGDMPVVGPVTGFMEVAIAHVVRVRG
jgi:hypothetical protein